MSRQKVYGVAELAAALGVKASTITKRRRRGTLPPPDQVLAVGDVWYQSSVDRMLRDKGSEQ